MALGKRENIGIFGDDWDTRDGTCIRDYIHMDDLIDAHLLALERVLNGEESTIFNLGSENGSTVKEVIEMCREVTGHPIPAVVQPRRAGDPTTLIASAKKAKELLGWEPKKGLKEIIESAWKWHKSHPNGFDNIMERK